LDNWIELPVVFIDKPEEEIRQDFENGIKYDENEYQIDWCSFKESEIVAFNQGVKDGESTIRLRDGDAYKVSMSYQELKKLLIK